MSQAFQSQFCQQEPWTSQDSPASSLSQFYTRWDAKRNPDEAGLSRLQALVKSYRLFLILVKMSFWLVQTGPWMSQDR